MEFDEGTAMVAVSADCSMDSIEVDVCGVLNTDGSMAQRLLNACGLAAIVDRDAARDAGGADCGRRSE